MKIFDKANNKKDETGIAFIIFVSISIIYLFPFFLGRTDTLTDIRDVLMYPWRYHTVDKKIQKLTLWEGGSFGKTNQDAYSLKTSPSSTSNLSFKLNVYNHLHQKLPDSNFYLNLDFKPEYDPGVVFDFGLQLVNRNSKQVLIPGFAVSPPTEGKENWYRAYFNLNKILAGLPSVDDLNNYDVVIVARNKSINKTATLYFRDLKLVCEDFSKVLKIHNYYLNDLIQMFTPFRELYSKSIKTLHLPFWNNYIFTGTEFLAEPQLGYFHPFYFFVYFLFDHFTAHGLITLVSLIMSGLGAFLLARYWKLSYTASLFTGIVYMFHPFNVTWFSYEHMLMNSASMPFLLLLYEKNLSQSRLLNKYLLTSAFLLGLIFLSGHLQYSYYTFIFFFLFALFKFIFDSKALKKHVFSILFVLFFGIIIGAIVLLPFFPLFLNSHRVANTEGFIRANSFPIKAFLGLVYPFYGGSLDSSHSEIQKLDPKYIGGFFNNYVYFGLLPLLCFIFSLKKLFSDKLVIFFCSLILLSFLICTGSPIYFLIKGLLPGFKQMQHYRFLQLYSYSVPFLSGIGLQLIIDKASFLKSNFKKIILCIIFLITIIDLMYYSSFFVTWSDRKSYKPLPVNGALKFLEKQVKKSKEPFRVLPFAIDKVGETKLKVNIAQPNTLLPYGIEDASGYSSFIPKDIFNLFVYIQTKDLDKLYKNEMLTLFANPNIPFPIYNFKSKILNLLNVKYFMIPSVLTVDSKYAVKVFDGDCSIYENKNCLPRAFVVSEYKIINSSKEIIQKLDEETFNPLRAVIFMSIPHSWQYSSIVQNSQSPEYKINFIKYEQNDIKLRVKINQPGFLILGNNLNNNWKVKINGKQAKHIQANLVQRAVYLSKAGSYLVEFYYYSKLFLIGLFITCFALFVLGLLAILLNREAGTK